ncbi:hypothetical protein LX32DRAFT_396660 [Colletotrichum zoysiae]|uniref:Uncharacterized protein n=1 Tax=Colletotrichum zoysiae TaxID=1216348 RepID=A0AAD9M4Q9_9PEZI|nr:hypothetical protein LX32DRAFT_396660 [Colletotrichum zoysiae]
MLFRMLMQVTRHKLCPRPHLEARARSQKAAVCEVSPAGFDCEAFLLTSTPTIQPTALAQTPWVGLLPAIDSKSCGQCITGRSKGVHLVGGYVYSLLSLCVVECGGLYACRLGGAKRTFQRRARIS